MWTLDTPWLELVIRSSVIFVFMFIVCRIWGRKHFGEMSSFDFVLLLIMSEAVQNALVDDDKSIPGGMITIGTMVMLNIVMNKLTFRSRKIEKILDGTPLELIREGRINRQVMNRENMTDQELWEALRMQGVDDLSKVKLAMMENNGKISVIENEVKQ